jgi:hypothetical protein
MQITSLERMNRANHVVNYIMVEIISQMERLRLDSRKKIKKREEVIKEKDEIRMNTV